MEPFLTVGLLPGWNASSFRLREFAESFLQLVAMIA